MSRKQGHVKPPLLRSKCFICDSKEKKATKLTPCLRKNTAPAQVVKRSIGEYGRILVREEENQATRENRRWFQISHLPGFRVIMKQARQ